MKVNYICIMIFIKKDKFNKIIFLKKILITVLGIISHKRFTKHNKITISGSEIIKNLPEKNILFISNHQTYFADATAMFHVFNASLKGRKNNLKNVSYLYNPKHNIYYIAAKETMSSGLIPKILSYTGAILVSRTWRSNGKNIKKRAVQNSDVENINKALKNGWLITFPQGTTTEWAPVRKGTAHIIKEQKPIVVPIVINGFRKSFDKTGLKVLNKNVDLKMTIKNPLKIDYNKESLEEITNKVALAIEQHESFK